MDTRVKPAYDAADRDYQQKIRYFSSELKVAWIFR
jgi:hypothetical protein